MSELIVLSQAEDSPSLIEQDDGYDRFLVDLWVGVVLSLMVLSCLGCVCTCFLYHTFKQWQRRVLETRRLQAHVEAGYDSESLPSYTVAAGLPTYEEAIEQLKQGASQQQVQAAASDNDSTVPMFSSLSVGDFLQIYKEDVKK